jgi:hypothetical protein
MHSTPLWGFQVTRASLLYMRAMGGNPSTAATEYSSLEGDWMAKLSIHNASFHSMLGIVRRRKNDSHEWKLRQMCTLPPSNSTGHLHVNWKLDAHSHRTAYYVFTVILVPAVTGQFASCPSPPLPRPPRGRCSPPFARSGGCCPPPRWR